MAALVLLTRIACIFFYLAGYAATGAHPVQPRVLESMRRLAAGDPRLERLAANHGDSLSAVKWVAACSEAASNGDPQLRRWCEGVMREEFRALLEHCYNRLAAVA